MKDDFLVIFFILNYICLFIIFKGIHIVKLKLFKEYIVYILFIILLILLIPQVYYWIKERQYKSLNMASKFFKRTSVHSEKNYEEMYLTNTDGFDLFVRILTCDNPKGIVQIVHGNDVSIR